MIVDEAHNAVTGLTRDLQARLNPSAIVEFTATPRGANNVLVSVTAEALKAEEMIKLPIRVRAARALAGGGGRHGGRARRLEAAGRPGGRTHRALPGASRATARPTWRRSGAT